jgi:hypothetical protein
MLLLATLAASLTACSTFFEDMAKLDLGLPSADLSWTESKAAAVVAAETPAPPPGVPLEMLERCMRTGAAKKGKPPAAAAGTGSADKLVLEKLESQQKRERCIRSIVAQHRKAKK